MKNSRKLFVLILLAGLAVHGSARADATLQHRYSFSETNGTTVADSVGNAPGTVKGSGVKWGNGQLELPGGENNGDASYVELPEKLTTSLSAVTFEVWATWKDESEEPWERLFDFGNSEEGKGKAGKGFCYVMLTTKRAGDEVAGFEETRNPDDDASKIVLSGNSSPVVGKEYYYAVVYDPGANVSKLYVNGKLVASDKAPRGLDKINDVNNWLGRSQWADNLDFKGSFNEFRIWDGALTADEIAKHQKAGPDQKLKVKPSAPEVKKTPAKADK